MTKALPLPDHGLVDYYVRTAFPDKFCCFIHSSSDLYEVDEPFRSRQINSYFAELCKQYQIDWVDFIVEQRAYLEFDTEEEMIKFVNKFPQWAGYCCGYSKGTVVAENS